MRSIDLNCDLGEGAGHDTELMPLITSANIACGGHAGDRSTMRAGVALAREHAVAVGAHPGFDDPANFGRHELRLSPGRLRQLVEEQVRALAEFGPVRHVKPHGALYHLAARERAVAGVIADAVRGIDPQLILFAPADSALAQAGAERDLRVAREVFADRTYRRDGSLTPRSEAGAHLATADAMVAQLLQMLRTGTVRATDGTEIELAADTVCLHGDGPNAVEFAQRIRAELTKAGIAVRPAFTPE